MLDKSHTIKLNNGLQIYIKKSPKFAYLFFVNIYNSQIKIPDGISLISHDNIQEIPHNESFVILPYYTYVLTQNGIPLININEASALTKK
jgi:hypothetical protein